LWGEGIFRPWLRNYHGEAGLNWLQFYWVDQDTKRQMGK
jgi:hypothetical protein